MLRAVSGFTALAAVLMFAGAASAADIHRDHDFSRDHWDHRDDGHHDHVRYVENVHRPIAVEHVEHIDNCGPREIVAPRTTFYPQREVIVPRPQIVAPVQPVFAAATPGFELGLSGKHFSFFVGR